MSRPPASPTLENIVDEPSPWPDLGVRAAEDVLVVSIGFVPMEEEYWSYHGEAAAMIPRCCRGGHLEGVPSERQLRLGIGREDSEWG